MSIPSRHEGEIARAQICASVGAYCIRPGGVEDDFCMSNPNGMKMDYRKTNLATKI